MITVLNGVIIILIRHEHIIEWDLSYNIDIDLTHNACFSVAQIAVRCHLWHRTAFYLRFSLFPLPSFRQNVLEILSFSSPLFQTTCFNCVGTYWTLILH